MSVEHHDPMIHTQAVLYFPPQNNYSFSGEFSPLAKLVVIVIMLRGRHREYPFLVFLMFHLFQDGQVGCPLLWIDLVGPRFGNFGLH